MSKKKAAIPHKDSAFKEAETAKGPALSVPLMKAEIDKQRRIINQLTAESNRFNGQLKIIDRNFDIARKSAMQNDRNLCKVIKRLQTSEKALTFLAREVKALKGKTAPKKVHKHKAKG